MSLDFENPTVQIALIAAIATVAAALISLLNALVTALVTLFNHLFEARTKRLERVKDIRSENAQILLKKIAETQSSLAKHIQAVSFYSLDFIYLVDDSRGITPQDRYDSFHGSVKTTKAGSDVERLVIIGFRALDGWFTPETVSSLFWFPRPVKLKDELENLIRDIRGTYTLLLAEISELEKFANQVNSGSDLTAAFTLKVLSKSEGSISKYSKEHQDKTFKAVVAVQRVLSKYLS